MEPKRTLAVDEIDLSDLEFWALPLEDFGNVVARRGVLGTALAAVWAVGFVLMLARLLLRDVDGLRPGHHSRREQNPAKVVGLLHHLAIRDRADGRTGLDREIGTLRLERPDDLLVLKNAKATSPLHKIGDIIGEVRSRGEDEWIGRHVWGGELTGNVEWGENGGLVIQRISAEELFVRYLDSIYKDGWIYVRSR